MPAKKAVAKGKRKGTTFLHSHLSGYGFKIGSCGVASQVATVICRFCLRFGRETPSDAGDGSAKRRKMTTKTKMFDIFRTDLYEKHMRSQHSQRRARFVELVSDEEKEAFFRSTPVSFVNTVKASMETAPPPPLKFSIQPAIVDRIIADLLFHPDDVEGVSMIRAKSIFQAGVANYEAIVKNPSWFRLSFSFLGHGASFLMASSLMEATKTETGIGRFAGCNESIIACYARILC